MSYNDMYKKHCVVSGISGSGTEIAMMNFLNDVIQAGFPVCYVGCEWHAKEALEIVQYHSDNVATWISKGNDYGLLPASEFGNRISQNHSLIINTDDMSESDDFYSKFLINRLVQFLREAEFEINTYLFIDITSSFHYTTEALLNRLVNMGFGYKNNLSIVANVGSGFYRLDAANKLLSVEGSSLVVMNQEENSFFLPERVIDLNPGDSVICEGNIFSKRFHRFSRVKTNPGFVQDKGRLLKAG